MPFAIKAELDAMMNGSFALHAFPKPHFRHQIDRALLEHASANRRFDPFSATAFENDRLNSFPREQQRQHQTSRACSNDSNTGSHVHNNLLVKSSSAERKHTQRKERDTAHFRNHQIERVLTEHSSQIQKSSDDLRTRRGLETRKPWQEG